VRHTEPASERRGSARLRGRRAVLATLAAFGLILIFASLALASKGLVGHFATRGLAADKVSFARSIAVNYTGNGPGASPGDVYVLDNAAEQASTVKVFNQYGSFVRQFGWDAVVAGSENTGANEQQSVEVPPAVTGGSFRLRLIAGTANANQKAGTYQLREVETTKGVFLVGDEIATENESFCLLPAGTTIVGREPDDLSPSTLILSTLVPQSGTCNLTHTDRETTGPIGYNATAATVQASLEALPAIGPGNVTVSGGPGASGTPYTITFAGGFVGHDDLTQLQVDNTLTGGVASATDRKSVV